MTGEIKISPTFDARSCAAVVPGFCVIHNDDGIIFAGPLRDAPRSPVGVTIELNPVDFETLRKAVEKSRH